MQTFLPYPDFRKSLECLDNKRLGKQRVEAMQLIKALEKGSGAWFNHPATQQWKDNVGALMVYHDMSIHVWKERGFKNTMSLYFGSAKSSKELDCGTMTSPTPSWFGDPDFHSSHRSNLLRKDPEHYGKFGWTEPHDLPYVWPTKKGV